jgi:hypothetical protein
LNCDPQNKDAEPQRLGRGQLLMELISMRAHGVGGP